MIGDELSHIIKQHVAQAMMSQKPFVYGHIANYDPATHRVRCIVPSMQEDNGQPLLTPWMPMATMSAGAAGSPGYGGQIVYQGGATVANPTGGEQVLIGLFDRRRGVCAGIATFYNEASPPPAANLPQGAKPTAPGDLLWSNPGKSMIRMRANGDIEVWGAANVFLNITGDTVATIDGSATVAVDGEATISSQKQVTVIAPAIRLTKAAGDALLGFCTEAFRAIFNRHVHGTSGPPNPQAPSSTVTQIVTGE